MFKKIIVALAIAMAAVGCTRIETGEVGLRKDFSKQIQSEELLPGSFNQTLVGEVDKYPVREISLAVNDQHPVAADNSPMQDFDVNVVYNLSPSAVSDLVINKSGEFHATTEDGRTLLMYAYLQTTVRNAVYKEARKYQPMAMNDSRQDMEVNIGDIIRDTLAKEGLDKKISIGQVQIKSIEPPQAVKNAAIRLTAAKAENQAKDVEVDTARKEAERIKALSANAEAIDYMAAQATLMIAEGVRDGKVNTIVIPADFKGIVNTK